ncbi:hypothetical protein BGW37DRAFT_277922 [Umbelopsis sp. PMI_123]|nr:hypothetical protein BGW37DRAFT_277922 [Umbelopsis sp. PMI_123]
MTQTIAIAGAGGIGKHLVDAIIEDGKHKLIALSRGENKLLADRGVEVRTVDYSSVASLTKALEGVNVVVSCLLDLANDGSQINLYDAAVANGVKRFIPSEWVHDVKRYDMRASILKFKQDMRHFLEAQNAIEYTFVCNGLFMDYLLPPGGKKYLKDVTTFCVNFNERKATVPGTGNEPLAMTFADDIGKAIVWLIDDPRPWPKYTYLTGSITSLNQLIQYGEEATGEKFDVTYKSLAELQEAHKAAVATGDPVKAFFAEADIWFGTGRYDLPKNEDASLFKDIQFVGVKELIYRTYGKK